MQPIRRFIVALFLPAACALTAWAGDVKVIANPTIAAAEISADDLKGVFLATRMSLKDGSHVEPVLAKGGPGP